MQHFVASLADSGVVCGGWCGVHNFDAVVEELDDTSDDATAYTDLLEAPRYRRAMEAGEPMVIIAKSCDDVLLERLVVHDLPTNLFQLSATIKYSRELSVEGDHVKVSLVRKQVNGTDSDVRTWWQPHLWRHPVESSSTLSSILFDAIAGPPSDSMSPLQRRTAAALSHVVYFGRADKTLSSQVWGRVVSYLPLGESRCLFGVILQVIAQAFTTQLKFIYVQCRQLKLETCDEGAKSLLTPFKQKIPILRELMAVCRENATLSAVLPDGRFWADQHFQQHFLVRGLFEDLQLFLREVCAIIDYITAF
jgi:hypothetical protein